MGILDGVFVFLFCVFPFLVYLYILLVRRFNIKVKKEKHDPFAPKSEIQSDNAVAVAKDIYSSFLIELGRSGIKSNNGGSIVLNLTGNPSPEVIELIGRQMRLDGFRGVSIGLGIRKIEVKFLCLIKLRVNK